MAFNIYTDDGVLHQNVPSVEMPADATKTIYNKFIAENDVPATPEGELKVTQNGTYDVTNYANVEVAVPAEEPTLQSKSVTPSTSAQTVTPDSGYDGLSQVTVGAVQVQEKSVTPSTSAQTVTPDAGKYLSKVTVGAVAGEPVLSALSVSPTAVTVPAGTSADGIKSYLTAMSGTYTLTGYTGTLTKDLTSAIGSSTVSGTMPTPGNTSTMTISYGGKSTTVSVTMEAAAPTLTGLTATYTGGAVAAGTTLDQLNVVVKATYSDGSTSAALTKGTDYTLSGMLTPGQTNTITVTGTGTYAGHTTTFSVTVAAAPPTLTGLTATYTGGTVAAGTTLAQLTEVVKATYSDGTTSAALTKGTDYTLSGTLTAGQANTVTVTGKGTYAGFTTSFSVTVEAVVVENNYWVSESVTGSASKNITFPISDFDASDFEKIRYIDITGAKNNTNALGTEIASLRLVKENGSWTLHEARQANQTSAVDETLKSVSLSGSGLAVSITTHAFNAARDYRLTCYDNVSSLPVANINESYDLGLANATGGNNSTFTIMARKNGGLIKQSTDLTSITIIEDASTFSPTNNAALKINSNKLIVNKDSQGTWTGTVEYRRNASDSPTTVAVRATVSVTTDEVFGNSIISITAKTTSNVVICFFYSNKNIGTIEIS